MTWIAIAVGGALGSMARHAVNHIVHMQWLSTRFPAGTVVVNVSGTTFSTFGLDTFVLARSHSAGLAFTNIAAQVVGGLLALWLGYQAGMAGR